MMTLLLVALGWCVASVAVAAAFAAVMATARRRELLGQPVTAGPAVPTASLDLPAPRSSAEVLVAEGADHAAARPEPAAPRPLVDAL